MSQVVVNFDKHLYMESHIANVCHCMFHLRSIAAIRLPTVPKVRLKSYGEWISPMQLPKSGMSFRIILNHVTLLPSTKESSKRIFSKHVIIAKSLLLHST